MLSAPPLGMRVLGAAPLASAPSVSSRSPLHLHTATTTGYHQHQHQCQRHRSCFQHPRVLPQQPERLFFSSSLSARGSSSSSSRIAALFSSFALRSLWREANSGRPRGYSTPLPPLWGRKSLDERPGLWLRGIIRETCPAASAGAGVPGSEEGYFSGIREGDRKLFWAADHELQLRRGNRRWNASVRVIHCAAPLAEREEDDEGVKSSLALGQRKMRSRAAGTGSDHETSNNSKGEGGGGGRAAAAAATSFAEDAQSNLGVSPSSDIEKEKFKEVSIKPSNKLLTLPTILTLARVAAVPALVAVFYSKESWTTAAGATIFVLAAITDWLDGYLARRMKTSSAFGAFLDPVADKLMVATALVLLCTKPLASAELAAVPWLLPIPTIAIIGREITMSAVREWAATQGGDLHKAVAVSSFGKAKTASQMIAITLLLISGPGGLDSGLTSFLGVGLLYVAAGLALWSLSSYMKGISGSLFK